MILNPNEEGRFYDFFCFAEEHVHSKYKLIFEDDSIIDCVFDTCCESDNCLELNDPNYEEYLMIVFCNIKTQELFEVNYHNMPKEVWCDGKKIDL